MVKVGGGGGGGSKFFENRRTSFMYVPYVCRSVEIVELWMETIHTNRVAVTKQLHENRQSQLCYLESVIKEKHEQCLNQTPLNLGHSTRDVDEKVKFITCFHDF